MSRGGEIHAITAIPELLESLALENTSLTHHHRSGDCCNDFAEILHKDVGQLRSEALIVVKPSDCWILEGCGKQSTASHRLPRAAVSSWPRTRWHTKPSVAIARSAHRAMTD